MPTSSEVAGRESFRAIRTRCLSRNPLGGDGLLPVWDDLLQLLIRLGEVGAGATFLVQASKGFLSILRACQKQWALRGAMPASLLGLILEREEWNYAQLARYLSVSLPIAVELLEYLGYVQDESEVRLFRLSDDPERRRFEMPLRMNSSVTHAGIDDGSGRYRARRHRAHERVSAHPCHRYTPAAPKNDVEVWACHEYC